MVAEIELTPTEIAHAAFTGIMRQVQDLAKGRTPGHGAGDEGGWQMNIEGALGELALAKYLGCYYAGVGIFGGPDVCKAEQCRTTSHAGGHLIIHNKDAKDARFWLLTGLNGHYKIRGWILGRDGMKPEWLKGTVRAAYFVPQSALNTEKPQANPESKPNAI